MKKSKKSVEKESEKEEIQNSVKLNSQYFSKIALKISENNNKRKGLNSRPTCSTPVCSWVNVGGGVHAQNDAVSARKLAAVVWEFHYFNTSATAYHHSASAGSLRRHIAPSLMQHHQSAERSKHDLRPLSPASYGSSLKMAPYNPAGHPRSSIEMKERIGESSYSFKTSTELLKVLNRIWSLEEQHTANSSLVKGLKTELDHARARIKNMLRNQRENHHEIDELMKNFSEDSLARKSKAHDRINAALQSTRDELEDERKLRKRSESLHRKLARELFEVKVALATSVKEFEKEKESSEVMEELCDEFAKGIQEYARQVHTTKQKLDKNWTRITDHDNLILHMSESWLDERAQVKDLETQGIKQPVIDRLRNEIDTFLEARHLVDPSVSRLRRCSLESIPEAVTAPQDSAYSDLHGEEVSKAGPSNYEEHEDLGIVKTSGEICTEISMLQKSDIYDTVEEQRKKSYNYQEGHGSNSKTVSKLVSELTSEGGSLPSKYEHQENTSSNPLIRRNSSPIRQWMTNMTSPDPRSYEASSRKPSIKTNTLKARFQPRSKEQRSQFKILKGLS